MVQKRSPFKLTLLLALLMLLGTSLTSMAAGYDFTYDNVCFKITSSTNKTVEVTQRPSLYSGTWIIPANPVYNGVTYTCTAIGDSAFYNCTGLTRVTLPNTITRIGKYAFYYCTALPNITLPSGLTTIEMWAFGRCRALTGISIPNTVTSFGTYVFYDCSSLSSATWSTGLKNIPQSTFSQCVSLTNFTIPHWVTSISNWAFYNTGLDEAIMPYGLKTIGKNAFLESPITCALIPSSVTSVASDAFEGCNNLEWVSCNMATPPSLDLPSSCQAISVPQGKKSAYESAITGCAVFEGAYDFNRSGNFTRFNTGLMTVTSTTPVTYKGVTYDGTAKYVYNELLDEPDYDIYTTEFEGHLYESDNMCGSGKRYLITAVGDSMLLYARNVRKIDLSDCERLESVGDCAFFYCDRLTEFYLPMFSTLSGTDGYLLTIGDFAFAYCSQLTEINHLTKSVRSIGKGAFAECTHLDYVRWPEGTTVIPENCFVECNLANFGVPEWITKIERNAFRMSGLKAANLPDGLTEIGDIAFFNCPWLKSANIPSSVTSLGYGLFQGCYELESVNWESPVTTIPSVTFNVCTSLTSFKFPHWITEIGESAFAGSGLQQAIMPYGLNTIGSRAFAHTNVTTVLIPSSAFFENVSNDAFDDCSSLTKMYCNMWIPPRFTFTNVPSTCKAYVPVNHVDTYRAAGNWGRLNVQEGAYDFNFGNGFNESSSYHMTVLENSPITYNGVTYDGQAMYTYNPYISSNTGSFLADTYETDNMCGSGKRYLMSRIDERGMVGGRFTSIHIPSSIIDIYPQAFLNCSALKTVTFADNPELTSIYDEAFKGCSALTSISIPSTVTLIGDETFAYCYELDTVQWSQGVKIIPYRCFYYTSIRNFKMPHWISDIKVEAFAHTLMSGNLILPHGIRVIGADAFSNSFIETALVPSSLNWMSPDCFNNCTYLRTLYCNTRIPLGMEFTNVPTDCKLYVPVGLVEDFMDTEGWSGRAAYIEAGAYDFNYGSRYDAVNTYHMTITGSTPFTLDGVAYDGTAKYVFHPNIKTATSFIADKFEYDNMSGSGKRYLITEIGDSCFYYSFNTGNTPPDVDFSRCTGLSKLGHDAFWHSRLKTLTLPASVTTYDEWALYSMPNMTDLYVNNPTPVSIYSNTFYRDTYSLTTLHVPTRAAVTAYSSAPVWQNFYSIVSDEAGSRGDVDGNGEVEAADISALIDYLLNGTDVDMGNADCDRNGSVDASDISALIDYLLNNTWPSALMAPLSEPAQVKDHPEKVAPFEAPAAKGLPDPKLADKAI